MTLCWRVIRSAPAVRRERTVRRRIYGGVNSFIGSARWWTAAYKCALASPSFSLPPPVFILALALSLP